MKTASANDDLLLVRGDDVAAILAGNEKPIIDVVKSAYMTFSEGLSSLPHSIFLRFPDNAQNRIIGLPAYSGGNPSTVGMKWIASFPGNLQKGIERASATIILNSTETGRPYGILEGSIISAKRTAASAALASHVLSRGTIYESISMIGCGLINFETFKFVTTVHPGIQQVFIYDLDETRAQQFAARITNQRDCNVVICKSINDALKASKLISFATTAPTPYLLDKSLVQADSLILHTSLRDLGTEIIRSSVNIVDDLEHVNRENTSIYLSAQEAGDTTFVVASIGDILLHKVKLPEDGIRIFSPFGLGVLDMALARYVYEEARKEQRGVAILDFIPESWTSRA